MKDGFYKKKLGKEGEEAAVQFLKAKGYRIIKINYECKIGELDIIAHYDAAVRFVEVRTKSSTEHGSPFESVNYMKQRKLIRLAQYYLKENYDDDISARFDVVSIVGDGQGLEIELIQDAFDAE